SADSTLCSVRRREGVARGPSDLIALGASVCRGTSGSPSAAPFEFLSAPARARLISAHFRWSSVRLLRFEEPSFVVPILFHGIVFHGIVRGVFSEGSPPGSRDCDVINGRLTLSHGFEHSSRRR